MALLLAGEVFWTQEETLPGEILPSPPPQKRAGGGLCLIESSLIKHPRLSHWIASVLQVGHRVMATPRARRFI